MRLNIYNMKNLFQIVSHAVKPWRKYDFTETPRMRRKNIIFNVNRSSGNVREKNGRYPKVGIESKI